MGNANRMRIICDPFKKEIEYQWYDSNIEDYIEFEPENSKLVSEEFVKATIQNRACEIVDIINKECNVGNVGLDIMFVGTEDDYTDFCHVIDTCYSKYNITCMKDNNYYHCATEVMPKIKAKFEEIRNTLNEYTEDEIAKLVFKYNDTVKPSISLCIMGLYSSGKSAFINSIVGAEILPSASNPTTAKICKIMCGKEYKIKFLFDGKECVLLFKGKSYKPNSSFDKEIIRKLQEIVESEIQHDEIFHMNRALDIINNYSSANHNISDIIEVEVPFIKTSLPIDEFDFVIYDTPGSNSDNNVKHFEVLRDSLDEQTNSLPIFLTTPDTMDGEDNNKILKLIEDTGDSLDTTNAIIVVNKSDEKGPNALKQKRKTYKNLRITKWKSTRIFFVSSLIGMASKKNNPDEEKEWLDADMYEIYDDKKLKYSSDGRKLFEYNIIDKSKMDEIVEYKDDALSTHLYKNSGLEAVEREIVKYASKYALYNKCQQASVYLQEAIELCVTNVQAIEKKLDLELTDAQGLFDEKKTRLCDQLDEKKKNVKIYNTDFQKKMEDIFFSFTKKYHLVLDDADSKKILKEEINEEWKKIKEIRKKDKEQKSKDWTLTQVQQYADEKYNKLLKSFSDCANDEITSFWDGRSSHFKSECINVVHDSKDLTEEQKRILESIVLSNNNMEKAHLDFNLRQNGVIRHRKFLFWELKSEKFDKNLCCKLLIEKFNNAVRNRIWDSERTNARNFKRWADSLISKLVAELCKFNSALDAFDKKISELNNDLDTKKECKKFLIESKKYIDMLLDVQGREGNV